MDPITPSHLDAAWYQVFVGFLDYTAAQDVAATHLAPILDTVEANGLVTTWFFTRKKPFWRLRLTGPDGRDGIEFVHTRLRELTGHIASVTDTIYEPEVDAFGGPEGMTVAHRLFHADSRRLLAHFRAEDPVIGRRELSVLLCSTLLRNAGQDWYEQGDVWARVAEHQTPLPTGTPPNSPHLRTQMRRLMTTDTALGGPLFADVGPPAELAAWLTAFAETGRALRNLAADGALRRGLRAVLTHHILFHWNRLGLDPHTKAVLARSAADAVFADDSPRTAHPQRDGADHAVEQGTTGAPQS
jgi:thiopeptide-type bacteriocin biosynthesis protein